MPKRILQGTVTSDKGEKTVIVRVERKVKHPIYKKVVRKSKKYAAHDETNAFRVGDVVRIEECRPMSKTKTWTVLDADKAPAREEKSPVKEPAKVPAKKTATKAKAGAAKPKAKAAASKAAPKKKGAAK